MRTCKTLFNKCINTLNNYTSFENYYDYLKNQYENNTFCEYYLRNKKEPYSYKEFFEKVETLAAFFQRELSEFAENSWVGIKLTNHPYYLAVCFALLKNNFNVMLLDNNGSTDYFDYVVKNSKLVAVVTDAPFESNSVKFISFQTAISPKLIPDENIKNKKFANKISLCTSGTTGYFNIVVYSGEQIMYQLKSVLSILKESPAQDMLIDNSVKFLVYPPLHHIFGIIMLLTYSFVGVTNVMCEKTTLSSFINAINEGNVAWAAAVPLIWEALTKFIKGKYKSENAEALRETLGENLKFCICGGAHTSPEVIKLFNKAKIAFSECYGMTEAGMVSLNIGQTEESRMNGSVGNVHTASCAMKILTTDGKILNEGIGELLISGNGIYASTLKNGKEIPIETFENSNFIKTGDLVEIKNGNIYFRDRIKDVIINSSGENVCPGELEKYFAPLLENNVQYTILGINYFPVIIISLSEENFSEGIKELLTQKVVETNKNLPLNKKVVAIYFTTKPFPITSALKVRKFRLKQSIEEQPQNYVKVELINKTVKKFSIEEIKSDLKTFFSTYLNLNMLDLNDGSLIIEELTADSLIMAELFIYIEEKYQINIEQEFILKNSLSIADVANMIFEKA